ncbi:DUF1311 domain-containing protein [Paracoccus sp. XHP0099]|uniref:DUF1311 domain-containing protein n=1 Tax=Paracoccus marinaquae TaxID=2841926 RepID=A0ABS6AJE5_9RHOB|nr:DUF1311 domain-containing protein [Paracoccus marinaquae]
MRALAAVLALLMATAAAAQDAQPEWPDFDGGLVDACLAEQAGEDARPESCIGVAADPCINTPGTYSTAGTTYCLGQELDHWDGLLNGAYQAVMTEAEATDAEMAELGSAAPAQAPLLREMQRSWVAYRDAACDYERSRWGGGSGGGPASVQCALTLTARQYLWLRDYQGNGQ